MSSPIRIWISILVVIPLVAIGWQASITTVPADELEAPQASASGTATIIAPSTSATGSTSTNQTIPSTASTSVNQISTATATNPATTITMPITDASSTSTVEAPEFGHLLPIVASLSLIISIICVRIISARGIRHEEVDSTGF